MQVLDHWNARQNLSESTNISSLRDTVIKRQAPWTSKGKIANPSYKRTATQILNPKTVARQLQGGSSRISAKKRRFLPGVAQWGLRVLGSLAFNSIPKSQGSGLGVVELVGFTAMGLGLKACRV